MKTPQHAPSAIGRAVVFCVVHECTHFEGFDREKYCVSVCMCACVRLDAVWTTTPTIQG